MKNAIGLTLTFLFLATSLMAKTKEFPEVRQMVALMDLTPEIIQDLSRGEQMDIVIECKEGTLLPLHFFANYGLFSASFTPNLTVKVEKTCYVRFLGKKAYMSEDLIHWEKPKKFFSGKPETNVRISNDKSAVLVESKLVKQSPED